MTEEQHVQAAEARRNLATVLKRNADQGMFTINLSTGHERTLYAFLDPACINCRLLEPALKQLAGIQRGDLSGLRDWRGVQYKADCSAAV